MGKPRKGKPMPDKRKLRPRRLPQPRSVAIPQIKESEKVTAGFTPDETWAFVALRPLWHTCGAWKEKAPVAEKILGSFLLEIPRVEHRFYADSILRFLTAFLETDGEGEITCIEQAALLRISSHESWRVASAQWLSEFGPEAMQRWAEPFPAYTTMATRHLLRPDDVGFR